MDLENFKDFSDRYRHVRDLQRRKIRRRHLEQAELEIQEVMDEWETELIAGILELEELGYTRRELTDLAGIRNSPRIINRLKEATKK